MDKPQSQPVNRPVAAGDCTFWKVWLPSASDQPLASVDIYKTVAVPKESPPKAYASFIRLVLASWQATAMAECLGDPDFSGKGLYGSMLEEKITSRFSMTQLCP